MAGLVQEGFAPSDYIALIDDQGNMLLVEEWADKAYEIHWLIRCRGRKAITAGVDFLRHLYQEFDARTVTGQVPASRRAARWFSRQVGGRSNGIIATELGEVESFSQTRQEFEAQHGISEIETTLHEHGAEVRQ